MVDSRVIKKEELMDGGIQAVFVEAVFMPNGELIRNGKSLGFMKEDESCLIVGKKENGK